MYRLYYARNITCLSPCKKEVGDSSKRRLYTFSNHKSLRQKIGDAHLKQTCGDQSYRSNLVVDPFFFLFCLNPE